MILNNRYQIDCSQEIGQGTYGKVLPCTDFFNPNLKLVAKVINTCSGNKNSQNNNAINRETQILTSLQIYQNPHIVKCYQIGQIEDNLIIIMEHCELGDLSKKLKVMKNQNQKFNAEEIIDFAFQIIDGARLMAQQNIFHRDIKPQNILLAKDFQNNINYKISDFGCARLVEDLKKEDNLTRWGSKLYSSPEIIYSEKFSGQSDIFSFGIVLFEFCFLQTPFQINQQQQFFNQLQNLQFQINVDQIKGSQQQLDLIKMILSKTLVFQQQNRMDWQSLHNLILQHRCNQNYGFYQLNNIQQNDENNYFIIKQHVHLLDRKLQLVSNLMTQYNKCRQLNILSIPQEVFKLYFTSIACYRYIIVLQIKSFYDKTYNMLSKNIKKVISQNQFQLLTETYLKFLQNEDQEISRFADFEFQNSRNTIQIVEYSIQLLQSQKLIHQESQSLLQNFIRFRDYFKNTQNVESLNYENFLEIINKQFYNQIVNQYFQQQIQDFTSNHAEINILLALQKSFGESEVFYPQQDCNVVQNEVSKLKVSFTQDDAIQFLFYNL